MKRTGRLRSIKKQANMFLLLAIALFYSSCSNFLDIVPDNVATLDHAFSNTVEAEKYLFTCYSYIPNNADISNNPGMVSGDEFWLNDQYAPYTWNLIAKGQQNSANPAANCWDGFQNGIESFKAIRHCNTFIENVSDLNKVRDLQLDKRMRWLAEVKFLKAYYHFHLLRHYGPIPLIDKNLPISATPEEVKVKRKPVDECVDFIVNLLDECYEDLPTKILSENDEAGRITKPINRAIKARVLLLAASPLFNGNTDYRNFTDKDGVLLFNTTEDVSKWQKAADAAKEAIDIAEQTGNKLYYYTSPKFQMTDTTMIQMSIRGAVTERWNDEVVWGLSDRRADGIQRDAQAHLSKDWGSGEAHGYLAPTLKIIQQFYTSNGVPITEDKFLNFNDIGRLRTATNAERVNFEVRYETARINFDRENRFYASVGFDGGKWLTADLAAQIDYEALVVKGKKGQISSGEILGFNSQTGYYPKKLVNWESVFKANSTGIRQYPWPEVRLADIYLMYAEALNEIQGPVEDVHKYLDLIRKRAGLESVADSWKKYSTNPAKPTTKEGMREIIRQERLIELCFEGHRFWDLRRWKKAAEVLNAPVTGWDVTQKDAPAYYQVVTYYQQKFVAPRDYLWPIRIDELSVNLNLVQNPGW
ncbi:RagB/SusD family nutrient uptake outer membrane protein [Prevotella sp. 10(H)]|uniref:RagB/SusD family nutrient uptake outer membrane protein n=1 Tax=Prevotella sp. 10(H) TaxID=1158294 RepID=UPI0004A6B0FA|nr:RagB/SusD family nutrient uptake outer membrane protein [Prevotella sp. 10(H)]